MWAQEKPEFSSVTTVREECNPLSKSKKKKKGLELRDFTSAHECCEWKIRALSQARINFLTICNFQIWSSPGSFEVPTLMPKSRESIHPRSETTRASSEYSLQKK